MPIESYSFIIYSNDKIKGEYNYDAYYNVDWNSLLKKYDNKQKFKVRWYIGSKNKLNFSGDNLGLLYIDFFSKNNQQDSKLNNNVSAMGLVKINTRTISSSTSFYLSNLNEYETLTISKPTSNTIRVYFRNCDNTQYFNGTNDGALFIQNQDLPHFFIKIELEPI